MKRILACLMSIAACAAVFTACSEKDSSVSDSGFVEEVDSESYERDDRYDSDMRDSSDNIAERVKDGAKSAVSGGAEVVDDAASTVEDVVSDVLR